MLDSRKLKPEDMPIEAGHGPGPELGSALLREIVEHTGEVVYRYRLWPTYAYEYISESVRGLLGYTPDELYADPALPSRLIYPDDAELMSSVLDAPSGQEVEIFLRWLRRDGRVVSTEVRCVVTRDLEGRPVQVDGVVRDVTSREQDRQRLHLVQWRGGQQDSDERSRVARVLIADDHELTRAGLRALLSDDPGLTLVAEAADGHEAVTLARAMQPDLALMDVRMPGLDGLEATRLVKRVSPMTSVLMLSMFEDAELLLDAVKAGAAGYVLKGASETALRSAIWEVLAGDLAIDARLARDVLRRLANEPPPAPPPPDLPQLSAREQEVVGLLARGYTNREIADQLIITTNTVKIHVEHILAKLGVSDRTQAAVRSIELGYIVAERSR
jgi:PAS domain S-box-containing protein